MTCHGAVTAERGFSFWPITFFRPTPSRWVVFWASRVAGPVNGWPHDRANSWTNEINDERNGAGGFASGSSLQLSDDKLATCLKTWPLVNKITVSDKWSCSAIRKRWITCIEYSNWIISSLKLNGRTSRLFSATANLRRCRPSWFPITQVERICHVVNINWSDSVAYA
jgi:hypothetical protein